MSFVEIHPRHRATLERLGLTAPEHFVALTGPIVSGHPHRHVLRLPFEGSAGFLKKEHRVSWRDRLANWWAGYGRVSTSVREGRTLLRLAQAGIPCPEVMALGEVNGQAFLLVREEAGLRDLRVFLHENPVLRRTVAQGLGRELARIHQAGFSHPDLYSKHVLVGLNDGRLEFSMIDWQRTPRRRPSWAQRCQDIAALDATLAENLATLKDRLACLRQYLRDIPGRKPAVRRMACAVHRRSDRLARKRRLRELRRLPVMSGSQQLLWLDGEKLCVTREYHEETPTLPTWLQTPTEPVHGVQTEEVELGPNRHGLLTRRWRIRPWRWLASWWRQPAFAAPEFAQAAALIRLERQGVVAPRLLALGHHNRRPWQKYSFLLVEPPTGATPFINFLEGASDDEQQHRRQILRRAGEVLHRIHEAGYLCDGSLDDWAVLGHDVVLTRIDRLRRHNGSLETLARRDLSALLATSVAGLSRTDRLRFFLGYVNLQRLRGEARQHLRRLLGLKATPTLRRRPTEKQVLR